MIKLSRLIFFVGILSMVISCKEAYDPPAIADAPVYLVVEGFINLNGSTNIRLSRSTQLKDTSKIAPETRAVLMIEDEQNGKFRLTELKGGNYMLPASGLNAGRKYRLRIKTASSSEYLSDFVEALQTPEIDSVNFKIQNNGVKFYVSTHDAQNKTKYYRWDYDETWLYTSLHTSLIEYEKGILQFRPLDKSVFKCWKSNSSKTIILGSSSNLVSDQIVDNPISFVTAESGKVSFGYSILVRQTALNKEAYEYWQTLKKNTEQLGSIFDPQPSIASGNIKCISKPQELVIGYLSASSVSSRRQYFDNRNFPMHSPSYIAPPSLSACEISDIMISPAATFPSRVVQVFSSGQYIPVSPISQPGAGIIGYTYSLKGCADCRVKGGTTEKPAFWP